MPELTWQPFTYLGNIWQSGLNPSTLDPWFFLLFLVLTLVFWKRLPTSLSLLALGVLLLPYFTRAGGALGFTSFTRYILLAFPVYIIMGTLFKGRLWLGVSVTALFAGLLFMYTVMFAQWYWVG